MRPLRCLQVVNVRWFNATAWYALFLSRLLKEAGHETLVLGLPDTDSFRQAETWGLAPLALPLNELKPGRLPALARSLRRLTREFKPDIVNCHRGEGFFLWGLLRCLDKNFALVRTRGDQRLPRVNMINRLLYAKAADALIATNSAAADLLLECFRPAQEKLFTVPGGVDTGIFYPDQTGRVLARAAARCGPGDFAVGILGRLDPVKGHEILIHALGLLRAKHKERYNLRLICIGAPSGLELEDIAALCRESGLGQAVVTGRVDNVRHWINALDLGVLSSVSSEAIARAALEILACDVPLLSSDIGVMPDILPIEFLTPLADIEALAAALENLWLYPEKLAALRAAGRAALERLKPENFLRGTLEAYQAAIASKERG